MRKKVKVKVVERGIDWLDTSISHATSRVTMPSLIRHPPHIS